jgi:predicted DNA-binding antitoxin AbrB/MazE fold protein
MVIPGHFRNGVLVPDKAVRLTEGQEVAILTFDIPAEKTGTTLKAQSVLDIPSVSLGALLTSSSSTDDLLGEMLEGRS